MIGSQTRQRQVIAVAGPEWEHDRGRITWHEDTVFSLTHGSHSRKFFLLCIAPVAAVLLITQGGGAADTIVRWPSW